VFIVDIYNIIKSICYEQHYDKILKFLEYFEETFLGSYKKEDRKNYSCIEHITNNTSESFNNNLFKKKKIRKNWWNSYFNWKLQKYGIQVFIYNEIINENKINEGKINVRLY